MVRCKTHPLVRWFSHVCGHLNSNHIWVKVWIFSEDPEWIATKSWIYRSSWAESTNKSSPQRAVMLPTSHGCWESALIFAESPFDCLNAQVWLCLLVWITWLQTFHWLKPVFVCSIFTFQVRANFFCGYNCRASVYGAPTKKNEEPEVSMDHFQKKVPDWLKSPLWLISGNSKNIPMVNHLSVQTTLFWCQKSQDAG